VTHNITCHGILDAPRSDYVTDWQHRTQFDLSPRAILSFCHIFSFSWMTAVIALMSGCQTTDKRQWICFFHDPVPLGLLLIVYWLARGTYSIFCPEGKTSNR